MDADRHKGAIPQPVSGHVTQAQEQDYCYYVAVSKQVVV